VGTTKETTDPEKEVVTVVNAVGIAVTSPDKGASLVTPLMVTMGAMR
jgi:hypothetical protein